MLIKESSFTSSKIHSITVAVVFFASLLYITSLLLDCNIFPSVVYPISVRFKCPPSSSSSWFVSSVSLVSLPTPSSSLTLHFTSFSVSALVGQRLSVRVLWPQDPLDNSPLVPHTLFPPLYFPIKLFISKTFKHLR